MILHIHNGDAAADVAKRSSIPGEHFVWREALIDGPVPQVADADEWRRRRVRHLSEAYSLDRAEIERDSLAQEEKLASFRNYEEVVLWFEHDLFCQLHLLYLLNWFAQYELGKTKLSLICIGSFPGKENFRGLGELNAEELESLFPGRQQVTKKQLELAANGWKAYRSSDPRDIENFLNGDTAVLPFAGPALKAHLRRFPSTTNGLGQIENRALQLISSGGSRFADLFGDFCKTEPIYGLGDAQFYSALRRMTETNQPLLALKNGQPTTEAISPDATFKLTDLGRAVMNEEADFVLLNGIEQWIGGFYLSGERNLWRWDPESKSVILT